MKCGLAQGDCPEAWNLEKPDLVRQVALGYAMAGSDIILTNSFGASRLQLKRYGLGDRTREINRRAAELSLSAAGEASSDGRRVVVAGDMGPSGKLFVMGDVEEGELYDAFAEQAEALKSGGVAWLVVETMIDRSEMEVAVRAAAAAGLPVVASMTYQVVGDGFRTVMGDSPEACVESALAAGASVVGANCGSGIDAYVPLAAHLRSLTTVPLWIKANAGLPEMVDGRTVYRMHPRDYCSHLPALLDAGVNVVGGCCGTNPEFIAMVRKILEGRC